jgi:2-hydroxychromene-2-carboxylate isomerase
MSHSEYEAAVAAFIRTNGVTRCPTACVVRTQGTVSPADQEALRQRADEVEIRRSRRRYSMPILFGKKSVAPL